MLTIKNIQLKIKFVSFKYGSEIFHRPYNANGKVIKKKEFTLEKILGDTNINNHIEKRVRI